MNRILIAIAASGLAGGCVTVERQSGALPDWARARAVELQGQGYPSLAAVPEKPTGLPDLPEWIARRDQLVSLNERMAVQASTQMNAWPAEDRYDSRTVEQWSDRGSQSRPSPSRRKTQ